MNAEIRSMSAIINARELRFMHSSSDLVSMMVSNLI